MKRILFGLVIIFILLQFVQIDKKSVADDSYHMNTKYNMPEEVSVLFKNACYNCHSNTVNFPWYSYIQENNRTRRNKAKVYIIMTKGYLQ